MNNQYYIKEKYSCNLDQDSKPVASYTDIPKSKLYQVPVYKFAAEIIKKHKLKNFLELGCGSGFKMMTYIYPFCKEVYGIDQKYAIEHCRKNYDQGNWILDDFDAENATIDKKFEMVFSADVIEHLVFPDKLLNKVKKYANHDSHIIISTPERDLVRGEDSYGPPANKLHVREWNQHEFSEFISNSGFEILDHLILPAKLFSGKDKLRALLNRDFDKTCQMVYCKIRQ